MHVQSAYVEAGSGMSNLTFAFSPQGPGHHTSIERGYRSGRGWLCSRNLCVTRLRSVGRLVLCFGEGISVCSCVGDTSSGALADLAIDLAGRWPAAGGRFSRTLL